MLGSLWASITLDSPALDEQLDILLASFPTLPREVLAAALATLLLCELVGGVGRGSAEASGLPPGWDGAVDSALTAADLRRGELVAAFGRHFSLRDLFKLCARMAVDTLLTLQIHSDLQIRLLPACIQTSLMQNRRMQLSSLLHAYVQAYPQIWTLPLLV